MSIEPDSHKVDLREYLSYPTIKEDEVKRRKGHLINLGFSQEGIKRLTQEVPTLYDPITVDSKLKDLERNGFINPRKMLETTPQIFGFSFENISEKLEGLINRGFSNPRKMVEVFPPMLGYAFNNIDTKLEGLSDRGFSNPIKMTERLPSLFALSFANIDAKIEGLSEFGFTNPVKMVERQTSIFSHSLDNIKVKLKGLGERGFADPIRMVERQPSISNLSFANIDAKIQGLSQRGFTNPISMIEKGPQILGLTTKNIDRRLRLLRKLINLYKLPFEPVRLMEQEYWLLGSKLDKLYVLARVLRDYQVAPPDLDERVITKLVRNNIEDTLVALAEPHNPQETIFDLLDRIKVIKKRKLTGKEKREKIRNYPGGIIRRRYFQGYP